MASIQIPFSDRLRFAHVWLCLPAVLTFILVSTQAQYEVDLWPHLNLGRYICETGTLPPDVFYSYRTNGEPVIDQNWLGQVILFQCYRTAGPEGTRFLIAVLYSTAVAALTRLCLQRCGSVHATTVGLVVCLILSASNLSARTQVFSYICFHAALTLLMLRTEKKVVVWISYAVLQIFWSNTHGAFPLGVILPGLFFVSESLELIRLHGVRNGLSGSLQSNLIRHYLVLAGISLAACFLNPEPSHTAGYLSGVIGRSRERGITEWQSTLPTEFTGGAFIISCLAAAWVIAVSRHRMTLSEAILLVVFLGLGMKASRMVIWWGSILPLSLCPLIASMRWFSGSKEVEEEESPIINTMILAAILVMAGVSTPWTRHMNPLLSEERRLAVCAEEPREAIRFLRDQQFTGRLFSRMEWGSYAAFFLPKQVSLHMDAMIDFFPDDVWSDYCTVMSATSGWSEILQRDEVDAVILPVSEPPSVLQQLQSHPQWKQTYRDDVAVVFQRL
ncbi:MAG: hypothetical protein ACK526_05590 [Planctomyces sp.]